MQPNSRVGARGRSLWLVYGLAGVAALATLVAGLSGSASSIEASPSQADDGGAAHDHGDHRHASTLGPDGRFTGPGEVWPPQIRGAADIVALDFGEAEAATAERALPAARAADVLERAGGAEMAATLASAEATDALGQRYTPISVTEGEIVPGSDKGSPRSEASLALFYSHDRAATVEVYLRGAEVVEVVSRPADTEQPPLAVDEKHRATELARAHWEAAGDDRIDGLEGFVILAVEADGTYYDSRVAYVSFHVDNTSRPELLTWVDLTDETVLVAEVDR